jgi:hypothetical protein
MSLQQAIDNLIAYVKDHDKTPDYGDWLPEFYALDSAVYREARALDLQAADMPREDRTWSPGKVVFDGVLYDRSEVQFFGRTRVPGCWGKPARGPDRLLMTATPGWLADMQAIRSLGEAKAMAGASLAWSITLSPRQLTTIYEQSWETIKKRLEDGTIRHKKLSDRAYLIALADIPAAHQDKFRPQK